MSSAKPDLSYKLDEYTRFTTMGEVMTEFVLGARFRKINGRRDYVSILNEEETGLPLPIHWFYWMGFLYSTMSQSTNMIHYL
jgi:hypothetical protein